MEESESLFLLHSHKVGLLYAKFHVNKKKCNPKQALDHPKIKVNSVLKVLTSQYFTFSNSHFIFSNTLLLNVDIYIYKCVCIF